MAITVSSVSDQLFPFSNIWERSNLAERSQLIQDATDFQAQLQRQLAPKVIRKSTLNAYLKVWSRFHQKKVAAIRSNSTLRLTRAAVQHILERRVLSASISDQYKLCVLVHELLQFRKCFESDAPALDGQHCENKGFRQLGKWLAAKGLKVVGPDRPQFRQRLGRASRIKTYPEDWRERILDAIDTKIPQLKESVLVLSLLGCRPEEIPSVAIKVVGETIQITVQSVKSLGGHTPVVRGAIYSKVGLAAPLVKLADKPGNPFCGIAYKTIDNLLQRTSQKKGVFPDSKKISVRCSDFRNQIASDCKLSGVSLEELALLLGHTTSTQQQVYGRTIFGRTSSPFAPIEILRSHEVRQIPTPFARRAPNRGDSQSHQRANY